MLCPLHTENTLPFEDIPKATREQALRIIENLVDTKTRSCVLSGGVGAGKNFLISHLPTVIDRYPQAGFTPDGVIYLTPTTAETPHHELCAEIEEYLDSTGIPRDEAVVVTSDPDTATQLHHTIPVVLKMDTPVYEYTLQQGLLTHWPVVDVNLVTTTADDVLTSLNIFESTGASPVPHEKRQDAVAHFMTAVMNKYTGIWEEFPLGCWVDAYSKAVTISSLRALGWGEDAFNTVLLTHGEDFERIFIDNIFHIGAETTTTATIATTTDGTPTPASSPQEQTAQTPGPPVRFRDLTTVAAELKHHIIGQDTPIDQIMGSLAVPAIGVRHPRPLRSFLFLGATGVGKTQVAKLLAQHLAEQPMNFVQIDMSEYGEKHNVSRLIGSPPGYVGSDEPSMLEVVLTKHPVSLILLDEVEKAHPDVWDVFLQVFQDGRLTTGQGTTLDFTNTIIIMTSNLGADRLSTHPTGFTSGEGATVGVRGMDTAVRAHFRPELINRIDTQIVFNTLTGDALEGIIAQHVEDTNTLLKESGNKYVIEQPTGETLASIIRSLDPKYGARGVHRAVENTVVTPVARHILRNGPRKRTVRLRVDMGPDGAPVVKNTTGRAHSKKHNS